MNHINNAKFVATHAIGATAWAASKIFTIASTGITTGATFVVPALTYTAKTFVEQLGTIPNQDREALGIATAAAATGALGMYIGKRAYESAAKKRCIKSVADENIESANACSSDSSTTTTRTISEVRNNGDDNGGRVNNNELLSKAVDPIGMADENKRKTELIISQLRKALVQKTKEYEILESEAKKRMCDGKTKLQQNKGKETESRVDLEREQCRIAQLKSQKQKENIDGAEDLAITKEADLETEIKQCEEEKKIAEAKRLKEANEIMEAHSAAKPPVIVTEQELPATEKTKLISGKLSPAKKAELEARAQQSTAEKSVIVSDKNLDIDDKDDDTSPTQPLVENEVATNNTSVTQNTVSSKNHKEAINVKTNDGSSTIKKKIKSAKSKSAFLTSKQRIGEEAYRDDRLPADYDYNVSSDSSDDDSNDDGIVDLTSDDIP
jgi:hypothetical protein